MGWPRLPPFTDNIVFLNLITSLFIGPVVIPICVLSGFISNGSFMVNHAESNKLLFLGLLSGFFSFLNLPVVALRAVGTTSRFGFFLVCSYSSIILFLI